MNVLLLLLLLGHIIIIIIIIIIIRPHCSTTYVDAACCYRLSSVVFRLVCQSHTSEPCKNGWTNRDAVWVEDLGGPGEPCIWWESRSPHGKRKFWGGKGASHCKV